MVRSVIRLPGRGLAAGLLVVGAMLFATAGHAEKLAWENFSVLQFSNLGRVRIPTSGTGVATVNGSGGLGHLTTLQNLSGGGVIDGIIPVTDPVVTAGGIVAIQLDGVQERPDLQGGVFRPISGAVQSTTQLTLNTMPTTGSVRICLYDPNCSAGLDSVLGETVNGVFVGGGIGGVVTIGGAGGIRISLIGAPWTVKTASVSNRTDGGAITTFARQGWAHGPASATSSTALTSGVIQLVTASQTRTIGIPGNADASGQISSTRFHFIPEPGLLLLLGSGAVGLALTGRARMRR